MLLWMREKAECRRCLGRRCSKDYLVRPTSIRRPREEDGEGRVPEEDGEGRVPEGGRAHGGSVSLRHCKLRAAVVVGPDSRVRRGECRQGRLSGYNSETWGSTSMTDEGEDQPMPAIPEDAPPAKEVEDPVVNKVLQE